jgi:hypothetical protein
MTKDSLYSTERYSFLFFFESQYSAAAAAAAIIARLLQS